MKLGLFAPIVIQHPKMSSPWESQADIEDLALIAEDADVLGYHYLSCGEHVAVPTETVASRGGTYWDPLATFGFLSARTRRIRFATQVLVLGYHHPLDIIKRYGTLDKVSGGRLILGVGVGSLKEEFELLGARFSGRGALADDAMRAVRAGMGQVEPEYKGEHFNYSSVTVSPTATQEHMPMWVGGQSRRSLRRAVELGDGWVPFGLGGDAIADMLGRTRLPESFEVVLSLGAPLNPLARPDECRSALGATRLLGASVATAVLSAQSVDHYREQLAKLAALAADEGVDVG